MIDSERDVVPGAREADDVLRTDPVFFVVRRRLAAPWILGVVLFALIVAMVVFGPSTESRFIYTDF